MKTIIIAEIGVNHNGSVSLAKKLIKKIACTGAHYVKFQAYNPDELVIPNAKLAAYQYKNLKRAKITQNKMLQKYVLNENKIIKLKSYAKKCKILFLLSVFDIESLKIFKKLKLIIFEN